ncbi:hypothetical protein [Stygiolobus caldivivus]|uniref:DUF1404 domain-containing protein n=1 Tax=Stygiolobus caldivivus TaxID=2824673 RepID=A0A8D5U5R5_9CREN|nr:hypothetical protein [Stygiolobus caldivivus]BCU69502.1 hypothetical protein KN1_07990 [Stygiolobus caldivivus]
MDYLRFSKYLSFLILLVSIIIYAIGDPIDKLLAYQGPVIGGAILGWYVLNSVSKDKIVESENGDRAPVTAILIRKYALVGLIIGIVLIIPWLTPFLFVIEESQPFLYIISFTSMAVGGFIIGYIMSSFKFIEKVILYSLGFVGDILYFFVIYIASQMFGIPQLEIVNYILLMVYGIKFPEGALFGFYVIKRVNAI